MRGLTLFLWMLQPILLCSLNHTLIVMNISVQYWQMSQYLDTVKGCIGLQCFNLNFTQKSISYLITAEPPALRNCTYTNYLKIQRKQQKLWHFQICNMSSNQLSASNVILKYENLKNGNKYQSSFSTFGQFKNDAQFPWFYSKMLRQMIVPWQYMKSFQKISFNVNYQKMLMIGLKPNQGYQKSINANDTLIFLTQGYPDDSSSSRLLLNLTISQNTYQMLLVANGKYIATLCCSPPVLHIYNISKGQVIYEYNLNVMVAQNLLKLYKVNETHILLSVGGISPWIGVWDLRGPMLIVDFNITQYINNLNFTNTSLINSFIYQTTLIVHVSTNAMAFNIFDNIEIFQAVRQTKIYKYGEPTQLDCLAPLQILGQKCMLCNFQCDNCQQQDSNACLSCTFGFQLQSYSKKCIPNSAFIQILNSLTIARYIITNGCLQISCQFLNSLALCVYQKFRYQGFSKNVLKIIHFTFLQTFLPYSMSKNMLDNNLTLSSNRKFSISRNSMLQQQYVHIQDIQQNSTKFISIYQFATSWSWIMQCLIFIVIKFILIKISRKVVVSYKINTNIFSLVVSVMQFRITFISFTFFKQAQVSSFQNYYDKCLLCTFVVNFFLFLTYSLAFYYSVAFFNRKKAIDIVSYHFKKTTQTLRYISCTNILSIMYCAANSFWQNQPINQKLAIICVSILNFCITIKYYAVYKTTLYFCFNLFYKATFLLFIIILLLDDMKCPQFFQVRIKQVQNALILTMILFTFCQVFFCLGSLFVKIYIDFYIKFSTAASNSQVNQACQKIQKQVCNQAQNAQIVNKQIIPPVKNTHYIQSNMENIKKIRSKNNFSKLMKNFFKKDKNQQSIQIDERQCKSVEQKNYIQNQLAKDKLKQLVESQFQATIIKDSSISTKQNQSNQFFRSNKVSPFIEDKQK